MMPTLTTRVHDACRALTERHLPAEATLFGAVWEAFWQSVGCQTVEELPTVTYWGPNREPVRVHGAMGPGDSLDSLRVIAVVASAASALVDRNESTELSVTTIAKTLATCSQRMRTPKHLESILNNHGVRLLAGVFDVQMNESESARQPTASSLWVEWCDQAAGRAEQPQIHTDSLDLTVVDRDFRAKQDQYMLFVDEVAPAIRVHNPKLEIPLSKFHAQDLLLLGLILEAFQTRQPIRYQQIHRRFFPAARYTTATPSLDPDLIHRRMSSLKRSLGGVLKPVLKAKRGLDYYTIEGQITYCWIRPGADTSQLWR